MRRICIEWLGLGRWFKEFNVFATRWGRRGVRVRRPTRPAGLGLHSSGQPRPPGTAREPGLGYTLRERKPLANSGGTGAHSFPRSAWECPLRRSRVVPRSPDQQSVVTATNDSIRASLVPTLRVGMPSSTLCVASDPRITNRSSQQPTTRSAHHSFPRSAWECPRRRSASPPIPKSPVCCDRNQRLDPRITRSHAPRGNALYDALRRLRSPSHQSVVTPSNDSIRA